MESLTQLTSYFHYPLVAGIETCPPWEALLKISHKGVGHSICGYHIYLAPTIKEELFCEWEIGIKQPWNFNVEIKFSVVTFSSVLILVDATNSENFLMAKISGITVSVITVFSIACWYLCSCIIAIYVCSCHWFF